jgi:hypothetical protein
MGEGDLHDAGGLRRHWRGRLTGSRLRLARLLGGKLIRCGWAA